MLYAPRPRIKDNAADFHHVTRFPRALFVAPRSNRENPGPMPDGLPHEHVVIGDCPAGSAVGWIDQAGNLYGCRDVSPGPNHDSIVRAWIHDARRNRCLPAVRLGRPSPHRLRIKK